MTAEAAKPPSRRARTTTRLRQLAHPRPSTRIRTCRKVADASLVPERARFAASRAEEHGISPPAIGRSRESPNHNGGPRSLQSQGTSRGLGVPLPPRRTARSSGPKPATLRASVWSTEAAKDVVARVGRIDRSVGRSPYARPSDRPKRRTVGLRASFGSTEASASLPARVGVVGPTRARGKPGDSLGNPTSAVSRWRVSLSRAGLRRRPRVPCT